MKRLLSFLVACTSGLCMAQERLAGTSIEAFEIHPNDIELSRLAQPTQYFDKIGPHAGLMGYESGEFEMWVWPWKVLRNFGLQFILGTSTQPIMARDIVRTISVTPELTTITFTYESFTVKEHILVPRDEPGAILLLDVHTTQPLSIIPGFIPVMQPMWPAGIGGQFSYWDDEAKAYVISEGQWRAMFLCGSPAGVQMAAPPAHMFADNPLQFRIDVKPGESDGRLIPIVIAGAMPDTTTWKMKMDSVKSTYSRIWRNAKKYYDECFSYYQNLRGSTLSLKHRDVDGRLMKALEWGKIALDNLMIVNPRLGYGMVAGFGLSGGGERPGFAWFFGGDAFINVLAMNSVGMFRQSRAAIAFTQKWQRQDNLPIRKKNADDPSKDVGKMAHELSQSDGLCDWWNDYHYGYNHADTTPWYLVAMGDYVRTSGDTAFLRQSWRSVKQAYEWCLSKDSDGDGLMDLKGAGLGALEFGKLVGIYADVYTCGVWVQGIKEMKFMAELVDDSDQVRQASEQFEKAQPRLEKLFWLDKEGYYSYGATEKGEQVHEKTPWAGVAMMFGLIDEERTQKSIEAFNSADLCTDWGMRSLSNKSELFDPTNYNYGAVWPFISSFFNTAQFKYHSDYAAEQLLWANIEHVTDHALGVVPEVFSGEMNEKLGEAYHHQGFSTTGYMIPLVRGLFGLDVDGLHKRVMISPHGGIGSVTLEGINVGGNPVTISSVTMLEGQRMEFCKKGKDSVGFIFVVPERSEVKLVYASKWVNDKKVELYPAGNEIHATLEIILAPPDSVAEILAKWPEVPWPDFFPTGMKLVPGQTNSEMRILKEEVRGDRLTLVVEGRRGKTYSIAYGSMADVKEAEGAELLEKDHSYRISFDPHSSQEYVRKNVVINFKPFGSSK